MSRGAEGRKSFGNYSALGKMIYVRVLGMGGGGGGVGRGIGVGGNYGLEWNCTRRFRSKFNHGCLHCALKRFRKI